MGNFERLEAHLKEAEELAKQHIIKPYGPR
jgi:hypothetical protein